MSTAKQESNILICGSKRFIEESLVFNVLTTFFKSMQIDNIIVSKTSGASQMAEDWAKVINVMLKEKGLPEIGVREFNYDYQLEQKNSSLYETFNLPDFVVQNDDFFQKGKEEVLKHNLQAIIAIPNPEGKLGASTRNIQRFCQLAGKNDYFFDCSKLRENLLAHHNVSNLDQIATQTKKSMVQVEESHQQEHNAFGNLRSGAKPR